MNAKPLLVGKAGTWYRGAWYLLLAALILAGCAAELKHFGPESDFMHRAKTQGDEDVEVTVSVMSPRESSEAFGVGLAQHNIQPVWIKITNKDKIPYIFLQHSVDRNYFTSAEVAYRSRMRLVQGKGLFAPLSAVFAPINFIQAGSVNRRTEEVLDERALNNTIIMPGEEESGFVFTKLDEGMKSIPVILEGRDKRKRFVFVIEVPGILADFKSEELDQIISETTPDELNEDELKAYLESLPPSTTDKQGGKFGDPLNLVLIGDLEEILDVFAEAGWDQTEKLTLATALKALDAFFTGKGYRYSPVSDLYFDKRKQNIALQRIRTNINDRLHLRLWYTPYRFGEKAVWVGQVSRDIGVKFTLSTLHFTTHLIDPDVDEARDYVFADLSSVDRVDLFGYVKGVGEADRKHPRKNLSDDPYYTDGLRILIEVSNYDTEPKFINWEFPGLKKREVKSPVG